MKKLLISISIVLMSSTVSLGQDTTINLPKPVAREVVKDLIRLDSISVENKILKQNFDLLSQISVFKDVIIKDKEQIIDLYKQKDTNNTVIIGLKDQQLDKATDLNKSMKKELRNEKAKKTFWQIFSATIVTFLGYLYITK